MSTARYRTSTVLVISILLSSTLATGQDTSNVQRSPEGITLIQSVVDASGGYASFTSIHDLVATGTTSAPMNSANTMEFPVTVSLRGLDQLRVDSKLPTGAQSFLYNRGGVSKKEANGTIASLRNEDVVIDVSHFFPLQHLAAALQDSTYSVTQPETVKDPVTEMSMYHFRLRRIPSQSLASQRSLVSPETLDYYVDPTTNEVTRVKSIHNDRGFTPQGNGRQSYEVFDFSNYSLEGRVLLPHKIIVSIDKRLISTITISSYKLNTGLTESEFSTR